VPAIGDEKIIEDNATRVRESSKLKQEYNQTQQKVITSLNIRSEK